MDRSRMVDRAGQRWPRTVVAGKDFRQKLNLRASGVGSYCCGLRAVQMCLLREGQHQLVTPINWYNDESRHDLHVVVRVDFAVTYLLADLLDQWFDVCIQVPLINSCERRKGQGLEAFGDAQVVPPPNVFLVRIIGPRVVRNADDRLLNVDETGRLQQVTGTVLICNWARDPVCGVC
jgi:hypothetical protein